MCDQERSTPLHQKVIWGEEGCEHCALESGIGSPHMSISTVLKGTQFMTISLSLGLLVLRLVAGLTLAAHGAQKLFGWFDGPGPTKLTQGFEKQGFKPAWLWVFFVILGEFGGGLSLAFGFLTPLGAAGAFGAMFMAIV